MNHSAARVLITEGFLSRVGRQGIRPELQCLQSIGFLETRYTSSWRPPGAGSNNFGAEQGIGPAGSFTYTDTHPQADGSSKTYTTEFQKFATLADGASALAHDVYQTHDRETLVLPSATKGDTLGFSTGLHTSGYYEGTGATVAERIEHHHAAVLNACRLMALEIGEPMPDGSAPVPLPLESLHMGMHDAAVGDWQRALVRAGYACKVDNDFGPKTLAFTIAYQKRLQTEFGLSLGALGVVGPLTRAAVLKEQAAGIGGA